MDQQKIQRVVQSMAPGIMASEIVPQMEGFDLRLKWRGSWMLLFPAAFLSFWLCGWAAGEGFAIWALAGLMRGTLALGHATTMAVEAADPPASGQWGGKLLAGGFLLLWLTLWTFGGIGAMRTLAAMVRGKTVYRFRTDGVRWRSLEGGSRRAMPGKKRGMPLAGPGSVKVFETFGRWQMSCTVPGDMMEIGPFENQSDATRAADEIVRRYRGMKRVA